jgi:hypothetical protein
MAALDHKRIFLLFLVERNQHTYISGLFTSTKFPLDYPRHAHLFLMTIQKNAGYPTQLVTKAVLIIDN